MAKQKITFDQCKSILLDERTPERIALDYDVTAAYIKLIKLGKFRPEGISQLSNSEFETVAWKNRKEKYVKTRWRIDKSKTKEQHGDIFDSINPKPI